MSSLIKRSVRQCPVILIALAASALSAHQSQAGAYNVVSESTSSIELPIGELLLTETVVQAGPAAINRFTMHRLRRPNLPNKGAMLLLPGLGNKFGSYLSSEDGDVKKSFAAFFARLGYEVWAIHRASRVSPPAPAADP